MLSVIILSVILAQCRKKAHYAECRYAECRYAECRYAECRYAGCRYAKHRYAECHSAIATSSQGQGFKSSHCWHRERYIRQVV